MSELIQVNGDFKKARGTLLLTVSAVALLTTIQASHSAFAYDDNDRPTVWIELGGQLNHLSDKEEIFDPAILNSRPSMFSPSRGYEGPPPNSVDETGRLTFEPRGSDWAFSVSVRYGRSNSKRQRHQQTYPHPTSFHYYYSGTTGTQTHRPFAGKFADTQVETSQTHLVLDFQAGRDVGLGLFGSGSTSVLNAGVRFAQFNTRSNISIKSNPDWHFTYKYISYPGIGLIHQKVVNGQPYHSNAASLQATRSFDGVGPSISWNASVPVAGSAKSGEVKVDWGIDAALLFGRQRTKVQHQTTSLYHSAYANAGIRTVVSHVSADPRTRSRMTTVPNVGGFAGATYRIDNFRVSAGYRADFFFGALDNGIKARKTQAVGFYGPFATVSVGLGG